MMVAGATAVAFVVILISRTRSLALRSGSN